MKCPNCDGVGAKQYEDGLWCNCPACYGKGIVMQVNEPETQLTQAQTMTPEAAVESAIMAYLAAKAQIDEYNRIADAAKKLIGDVMLETGATAYSTKAGKVSMTNASVSVSYDTKALDALIASSDEVRRMLEPHRKVSERAGTMRIVGAK